MTLARRLEFPTLLVAVAVYGGWLALTWFANRLPVWVVLPLGAYLIAWHGSLQHETIHGHPTGHRWLNTLLAVPPLALWLPYPIYRESHLVHHRVAELTCPRRDPESLYVEPAHWRKLGGGRRALWWIERRLLGRMLLGPLTTSARFWRGEILQLARGDRRHLGSWLVHLALVAALFAWVVGVCEIGVGEYLLCFAYPGFALSMLRSFTEHRPGATQPERSAIVESGPLTSLLFLNNNLHVLHHADPSIAWYQLPRRFRAQRAALIAANGNFVFRGYLEIVLRYGLFTKDLPVHPHARAATDPGPDEGDDDGTTAASIA